MVGLLNSSRLWLKSKESFLFPFLAFAIPLLVRTIPEVLMGPFVVGFDTLVYYIPNTLTMSIGGLNFWILTTGAPFIYLLLMGMIHIGVPAVLSVKILSPVLLGLLGIVVYFYAKNTLVWSPKKSLLVVLFAALYFVALRVSWDLLRSELGLVFLFVTLILIKKIDLSHRNGIMLSLAMLLVVFANPIVSVVMFVIVIASILHSYMDKRTVGLRKLVICSVPAACLFFFAVYANLVVRPPLFSGFPSIEYGGEMALLGFSSSTDLIVSTVSFLAFCTLPLLPLIVLGARRFTGNLQLNVWIFWVLFLLFFTIIFPTAFFSVLPYRWILLLTYPLAFFAAEGLAVIKRNSYKIAIGLILAILSIGFMVLPNDNAFPLFKAFPAYMPNSMLQNTVDLADCQDTVNALSWAQNNMPSNSNLLVHDAFYGWASLTLNSSQLTPYGFENPETVARKLQENGTLSPLFSIWWVNGSGWYGQPSMPSSFAEVYRSGRIAIFIYNFTQ